MRIRQHRCPFYLLKIIPKDLEYIKKNKIIKETSLKAYETQINNLTSRYNELKACIIKISDIIEPFKIDKKILTLEECVEKSLLNTKTKNSTLSLIRQYSKYCSEKLESELNDLDTPLSSDNIVNLYNPQNAYDFIVNNDHYKRSSIKKNLNTLLRYIKLASNNPYLKYNLPIGVGEPAKLKHIITKEELIKFIKFLNSKHLYVIIIMCMLMYKFGLRIGALSKIKANDLLPDNVIIFKEKNSKLIKRKLLIETADLLKLLIKECNIDNNQYLFYFFQYEDNEDKRSLFFTQKFRNLLHDSKAFSFSSEESLSSHIFRATHAINLYKGKELENVRNELGHKFTSTSINSYINPERRELNILEENNTGIFDSINFLNKRNENKKFGIAVLKDKINQKMNNEKKIDFNIDDEESLDFNKEGEDFIDDDFQTNGSIFFLGGHFYEDVDYLAYKSQNIFNNENSDNNINILDEEKNTTNLKGKNIYTPLSYMKNLLIKIILNVDNDKNSSLNNKKTLITILDILDFKEGLNIRETDKSMITANKIKNKKELYILSKEQKLVFDKTIDYNKNGFYFNMKAVYNKGNINIVATKDILKNTLITLIGGNIYYYKDFKKINPLSETENNKNIILLYFKTAKCAYDRIIEIPKKSIINYFLHANSKKDNNLEIIRILDSDNLIKLIVLSNKIIKRGEILLLNKNMILNN